MVTRGVPAVAPWDAPDGYDSISNAEKTKTTQQPQQQESNEADTKPRKVSARTRCTMDDRTAVMSSGTDPGAHLSGPETVERETTRLQETGRSSSCWGRDGRATG